jgi:hypothetical protein
MLYHVAPLSLPAVLIGGADFMNFEFAFKQVLLRFDDIRGDFEISTPLARVV